MKTADLVIGEKTAEEYRRGIAKMIRIGDGESYGLPVNNLRLASWVLWEIMQLEIMAPATLYFSPNAPLFSKELLYDKIFGWIQKRQIEYPHFMRVAYDRRASAFLTMPMSVEKCTDTRRILNHDGLTTSFFRIKDIILISASENTALLSRNLESAKKLAGLFEQIFEQS